MLSYITEASNIQLCQMFCSFYHFSYSSLLSVYIATLCALLTVSLQFAMQFRYMAFLTQLMTTTIGKLDDVHNV